MLSIADFMRQCAKSTDGYLTEKLQSLDNIADLKAAMLYSVTNGGKRFRPSLIFATLDALSETSDHTITETLGKDLAVAIECIHAYSLIHDDLPAMDDDDLRRGQPTCHIQYNEATAILAGDALQCFAFEVIATSTQYSASQKVRLIQTLAHAAGAQGMVGGQADDLSNEGKTIDQATLEQIHARKTGALIRACTEMACIAVNAPTETQQLLSEFSEKLGLAFQVSDDILDITSSTEMLGKPQGADEQLDKATYPKLMGLAGAQTYLQQLKHSALTLLEQAQLPKPQLLQQLVHFVVDRNH